MTARLGVVGRREPRSSRGGHAPGARRPGRGTGTAGRHVGCGCGALHAAYVAGHGASESSLDGLEALWTRARTLGPPFQENCHDN